MIIFLCENLCNMFHLIKIILNLMYTVFKNVTSHVCHE